MNAIVVEEYGGTEKLVTKNVAKPTPEENDILVKSASQDTNNILHSHVANDGLESKPARSTQST